MDKLMQQINAIRKVMYLSRLSGDEYIELVALIYTLEDIARATYKFVQRLDLNCEEMEELTLICSSDEVKAIKILLKELDIDESV